MDDRVFASLPDRDLRREGLLIGEGRLVAARVAERCKLVAVLAEPSAAAEAEALAGGRCPVSVLRSPEIAAIAGYPFHRGILVAAERPAARFVADAVRDGGVPFGTGGPGPAGPAGRVVALPNPADAENLGAIARSAAALGWDALLLGPSACDPYGRRALRCSMGATLVLPLYRVDSHADLGLLRALGWKAAAAASEDGAAEPAALGRSGPLVLILGNERDGIPLAWRGSCDWAVAIPQSRTASDGVDSLNVAAAAAILLWEGRRIRTGGN